MSKKQNDLKALNKELIDGFKKTIKGLSKIIEDIEQNSIFLETYCEDMETILITLEKISSGSAVYRPDFEAKSVLEEIHEID